MVLPLLCFHSIAFVVYYGIFIVMFPMVFSLLCIMVLSLLCSTVLVSLCLFDKANMSCFYLFLFIFYFQIISSYHPWCYFGWREVDVFVRVCVFCRRDICRMLEPLVASSLVSILIWSYLILSYNFYSTIIAQGIRVMVVNNYMWPICPNQS